MLKYIDEILHDFSTCFSRKPAYQWFVVIVMGLMIRSDHLGVTSIIRDLALNPKLYETMNHFFRSSAFALSDLQKKWLQIVSASAPLVKEGNYTILIGDGVKQAKEAKRMPGVKKQHQESENSSKPEYMFGHLFGCIGVLAGNLTHTCCIPLLFELQDGIQIIRNWQKETQENASHVVQMIELGFEAAKQVGTSILVLDRYFLSVPALTCLEQCNQQGQVTMHIVTKAKKSCKAYEKPPIKKPGRGRPKKHGDSIKLSEWFQTKSAEFQRATLELYGNKEEVRFFCIHLLWGIKRYQELRFVLVEFGGKQSILVSTDLTLDPTTIIRLYSYRFKIECTFRTMKQVIGGFCYHFWTKSMPKLKRYLKKGEPAPMELISDPKEQNNILLAVKAMECYVQVSGMALGILQMLALKFSKEMQGGRFRFLRTPSKAIVSEATVSCYLRKYIFHSMAKKPNLCITQFIYEKQKILEKSEDLRAS